MGIAGCRKRVQKTKLSASKGADNLPLRFVETIYDGLETGQRDTPP